ncbi:vacuole membrane protein 1 isoform X2 [Neodiprion pinetum]|uniref:Vacuole membrane protein 1 isoform X2 n=1 Tax=Neodiprion lecontei TaxID=441921 RepID=A0ABM3FR81_NEOLC|nr:vacuole membrane protein 1-like isoform X2 [Neodiprion fabricii]XP_046473012.1 vacuole membrane protein 1-like isoform X2 [Neodiprion pinetum]XP_046590519.1 vacuole membrane protein 1 isoform X2 [Neodiprion lecontei]XP_046610790.1 vacuole membrane protein 1-like isoform X2 [Neodiprion virginianus]
MGNRELRPYKDYLVIDMNLAELFEINRLGATMSENTSAVRRTKDTSTATNGTRQSTPAAKKSSHTSQSHLHSNQNSDLDVDPDSLTLWHHPIKTLNFFLQELLINVVSLTKNTFKYRKTVWSIIMIAGLFLLSSRVSGPQQQLFKSWEATVVWWFYWVGLGVLSSVGLGTGLHTFVLYLGPHIASVTMAAYECGGLNFPEPPYPDQIVCPSTVDPAWTASVLNIMRKVRIEAMLWGAGTALGELPPYFMARAARLSRQSDKDHDQGQDQEELRELEALEALENGEKCVSLGMRAKLAMKHFVQKAGFLGILACASIPNPLFDLAGLTCGHYLIPFWTFFGATLVGKAVVKMHIQQLAVIVAFNEELLDKVIALLAIIPVIGPKFQEPLKRYLIEQKQKLHDKSSIEGSTTISWLFDKFVMLMVCYFLVTIIHALARNHHRRRTKSSTD